MLILELFLTFFYIGIFTFGGGYAIMSLIQSEVVVAKGWISESVFTDIAAISQMTPGPIGLNCSTYTGYEVLKNAGAGMVVSSLGSLAASVAIVLPSFLIMLAIVRFYARAHNTPIFKSVMTALKPAVAGLIGAAAFALMFRFNASADSVSISVFRENFPDWKSWVLFAAAFAVSYKFKNSTIKLLLAGGLAGLILY
ncbi:MAG: chromate transporter [Bacteroidales bacterium]|nr:chromate transporter [Bacteroidales bacterium]